MTVNKDDIRGIMPPAVTPFGSDDSVDEEAYRRDLRFMLEVGVQGLVCGGSTGEGATLSLDEARRLYSITATAARLEPLSFSSAGILFSTAFRIRNHQSPRRLCPQCRWQ